MSEVIRVGLGGLGRSGFGIHGAYLRSDPRFQVVAAADLLPERRAEAKEAFGCRVFEDCRSMLEEGGFDLFVNATPSRLHVEYSLEGLSRGFHVISEKPAAPTVRDFDRIAECARAHGVRFFPFQNSRYQPYFRKIREVISSGVLGEILCIRSNWSSFARRWDWQTRQDQLGGNLFNTGPHPLDQAIVLFGEKDPEVFCHMAARHHGLGGDADNFCLLSLYGEGCPLIEIQISSFLAWPEGDQYSIQGTCGGLTGGPSGLKWKYFFPADAPKQTFWKEWSLKRSYCSELLPWQTESWTPPENDGKTDSFLLLSRAAYSNFFAVLKEGAEADVRLEEVRRQVRVLEEAHRQNPLPRLELP